MPSKLLQHRTWLIAIFQAALIFTGLLLAWLLRFDFALPDRALLFSAAPLLIAIRLAAIGKLGLFHGWWRYTGINDAVDVLKAIAIGSAGFLFVMRFSLGIVAFPRTVYILEALISLALLVGVRFLSRLLTESDVRNDHNPTQGHAHRGGIRCANGDPGDHTVEEHL